MKKMLSVILTIGFLICLMPAPVFAFKSDNKQSNSSYTDKAHQNASKPKSVIDASLKLKQSTQLVKSRFEMVKQKQKIQKKNAEQNEQQSINNDSKNLEKPKTEKSKSIFLINHSASKTKPLS